MGVFHVLALLGAALPLRAFADTGSLWTRAASKHALAAYVSAVAVVASYATYTAVFDRTVDALRPFTVRAGLPVHFLNLKVADFAPDARADGLLALACCEAVALGVFLFHYGALERRARGWVLGLVAAGLGMASLAATAADSADAYLYTGFATLGVRAFSPPDVPFSGDLHAINAIWGTPMYPCAYGPVWIAVSALLVAPLGSLAAKLFAFKVLGLASIGACAYLARHLGAARTVVAAILCNPAFYLAYVASAHNDLFAVDLVLAAMLAARRNASVAFALGLAGCLCKFTLVPVAILAAATLPSLRRRAVFAALLVAAVAAAYAADGGLVWNSLMASMRTYGRPLPPLDVAFRVALAAVALGAAGWALARGRTFAQAAWAPPAFSDSSLPSYTIWGLPFALGSTPVALVYLVTMPFLSFFQNTALPVTTALGVAGDAFVAVAIGVVAYRLRPRPGVARGSGRPSSTPIPTE